jgi:GNAT superfamily N-acetyltransferase
MSTIRLCRDDEVAAVLAIINAAASAYRGVIPPDRWHEPYMTLAELQSEMRAGVEFWGFEEDGALAGIMGIQPVRDVELIRHAYVRPDRQRHGIGAALIEHLRERSTRPMLVGTWAAATWAIAFYQRHGFELVERERAVRLLQTYWEVPQRQIETSVVLAQSGAQLNAIMLA